MKRRGIYYWAGPGTIRMIQLKFPGARIDTQNLLTSYDYEILKTAQKTLDITDAWISYSWGFSPKTEAEDYLFTRSKLKNFQKLNIKTHGYIQGCNLVLSENQDHDYYCRDGYGKLIPYHRGRKMTCPNNPYFQKYIEQKVARALKEGFDGIYVDNINFGQFPLIIGNKTTFFGCCCSYCQKKFKKESGFTIPKTFNTDTKVFSAYTQFRKNSLMLFVKNLSQQVKAAGKEFGTNSFDAKYDAAVFYGTDISELAKLQSYLLFENHDMPTKKRNNAHIGKLVQHCELPIFVVSYKKGVGRDAAYTQHDFDTIYSESKKIGYDPCYKATEYTTQKIWHNLNFENLRKPKYIKNMRFPKLPKVTKQLKGTRLVPLYNRLYNPLMTLQFENIFARKAFGWLYYSGIT